MAADQSDLPPELRLRGMEIEEDDPRLAWIREQVAIARSMGITDGAEIHRMIMLGSTAALIEQGDLPLDDSEPPDDTSAR